MATKQNKTFLRTVNAPLGAMAGQIIVAHFPFSLTDGLPNGDVLEVGLLPAGHKLHTAILSTTGIAATATVDCGFLSGTAGDLENTRTLGTEIAAASTKNTVVPVTANALVALAVSNKDRGLGIKLSAAEAAGAGKSGYLIVEYYRA